MNRPPRVVVAPDSFKGSLDAHQAARAIADGVRDACPGALVECFPMADGGEGTSEVLAQGWDAPLRAVETVDALGRPVTARYALRPPRDNNGNDDRRLAVVEIAQASGLPRMSGELRADPGAPWRASSYGTGLLLADALDQGAREILLCLGGSATTDGGMGLLAALGARFLDAAGGTLEPVPSSLSRVRAVDWSGIHPGAARARWRVACDVDNPLTGPRGSAAVFGPQKGVRPEDIARFDAALSSFAQALAASGDGVAHGEAARTPGMGAAGGAALGLVTRFGAELVPGSVLVAEAVGLPAALSTPADLVLTGEGSFDRQSLDGKVVSEVARLATASPGGPSVVVLAGKVGCSWAQARAAGVDAAFSLADGPAELEALMARTGPLLRGLASMVAGLALPTAEATPAEIHRPRPE